MKLYSVHIIFYNINCRSAGKQFSRGNPWQVSTLPSLPPTFAGGKRCSG